MARLIDADKLREDWLTNGENEHIYDTNAFLDSIDEQLTVDAVEVVRCEECAFWDYQGVGSSSLKRYGECKKWYPYGNEQHSCYEDDFCSCGVKREEASNGS